MCQNEAHMSGKNGNIKRIWNIFFNYFLEPLENCQEFCHVFEDCVNNGGMKVE